MLFYARSTMDGMVRVQAAMKGIPAVLLLPRRLREAGWGVLLVPVALLVAGIFGKGITWGITAKAAAAAALLVPLWLRTLWRRARHAWGCTPPCSLGG